MARMQIASVTKRSRGFFGWLFLVTFWLFQALMVWLVVLNARTVSTLGGNCAGDAACQAGTAIGGGMIAAVGWFVWILGTLILGLFVLFSRGKEVTYHSPVQDRQEPSLRR